LCVAPLALLSVVLPFDWLAIAAHTVMSWCMWGLEALSRLPAATWRQHAPPWWAVPLALAGAGWILLPRGFPARWVGASLLLPLLLVPAPHPGDGELWITVLDVGQGLAVVVRTRNHSLLFDAGPAYAGSSDAGGRIVVPYLRGEGVRSLDAMLLSHDDLDHTGGAGSVLAAIPVARLLTSLPAPISVSGTDPSFERCEAGQQWTWDGVQFEILHPDRDSYNSSRVKDNDRSCVLRIGSNYGGALIPADIERRSEGELLRRAATGLKTDILLAPHHGSRTSSSEAFVAAVAPRLVVFAVGHRNPFGHPHPVVAMRYRQSGARLLRSDTAGAIILKLSARGTEAATWRSLAPRCWHDQ
ncbi:MAG: ComEC/Rec2 family competence protein, partial [Burkholderiales bacterium]